MGKCGVCGKKVLGRKRKCKQCKSSKNAVSTTKGPNRDTYSLNNKNEMENENQEKELERENNVVNESFIDHLLQLNINDVENEEENQPFETIEENDRYQFFEIDSIQITLNELNIPQEYGNLTIYTNPKIFHIKKKMYSKIGWIFYLASGFQCNILTSCISNWSSIYKKIVLNIANNYKKYFLQILPLNLDKVVFNEYIDVFLASMIEVIDQDVFLYGKGLKCVVNTQHINKLLLCLSKNHNEKGRIDLAKSLYDGDINMKFDPDLFKNYIDSHENYKTGKIRLFTLQFGECVSLIAPIKHYGITIGEITCYYHNSIIYRKLFENNKHTIPMILGKTISDKCKYSYISKNNYIIILNEFANCLKDSYLIRRIEFRILNFNNFEENFNFFNIVLKDVDKFSSKLSNDFPINFNIVDFYIKMYESNNLLNDQVLLEELIRVFFLGLDSEDGNNMIGITTLKLLIINIRNKYKIYLNTFKLNSEIDFLTSDSLILKRIFNSFCKDKQIYSIVQYICAGYSNDGLEIAKQIIQKIFMDQLLIDYLYSCNSPENQFYNYKVIKNGNEYNIELYLRVNDSLESSKSIFEILSSIKNSMKQGTLPSSTAIGDSNTIRIRNRVFSKKYSYGEYSKLLLETFLNLNESISGFSNSQLIIQIVFILYNYINKYTWGELNDIFEEFCDYISEFLCDNSITLFPLYTFTKLHTQLKNCYQWITLYDGDTNECDIDSLDLNFNILNFSSDIEYFEPFEIYDNIINTVSNTILCYRLPDLPNEIIFERYIQKINPKFNKDTWESSISINRSIIMNNKEIYITILRLIISNEFSNPPYKFTKHKLILAARYLMYISGTIFMKSMGILTKGIRKDEIKKILPIFEEVKTRNAILLINEQKFKDFYHLIIS